jgi:hypothetical protein
MCQRSRHRFLIYGPSSLSDSYHTDTLARPIISSLDNTRLLSSKSSLHLPRQLCTKLHELSCHAESQECVSGETYKVDIEVKAEHIGILVGVSPDSDREFSYSSQLIVDESHHASLPLGISLGNSTVCETL